MTKEEMTLGCRPWVRHLAKSEAALYAKIGGFANRVLSASDRIAGLDTNVSARIIDSLGKGWGTADDDRVIGAVRSLIRAGDISTVRIGTEEAGYTWYLSCASADR